MSYVRACKACIFPAEPRHFLCEWCTRDKERLIAFAHNDSFMRYMRKLNHGVIFYPDVHPERRR